MPQPAPIEDADRELARTAPGWNVTLVHESDSGIWNTGTLKCFSQYGYPGLHARRRKRVLLLARAPGHGLPPISATTSAVDP